MFASFPALRISHPCVPGYTRRAGARLSASAGTGRPRCQASTWICPRGLRVSSPASERILYLKEIKTDISFFKRSYERADLQVTIAGLDPEAGAAAIDARLGGT